jgi:hypothetical protein
MPTLTRGNDFGNATLTALALIIIFSTVFISFVPRIVSLKRYAGEYKARVMQNIEDENRRITDKYDLR